MLCYVLHNSIRANLVVRRNIMELFWALNILENGGFMNNQAFLNDKTKTKTYNTQHHFYM